MLKVGSMFLLQQPDLLSTLKAGSSRQHTNTGCSRPRRLCIAYGSILLHNVPHWHCP
jgi:hypothetical protein